MEMYVSQWMHHNKDNGKWPGFYVYSFVFHLQKKKHDVIVKLS